MRKSTLLGSFILSLTLVLTACHTEPKGMDREIDTSSVDANEIVGEWRMIKSVVSGKESPDDVGIVFVFTKDQVTISDPKGQASDAGTRNYSLKPDKKPAEIDLQRESAERADRGIYKLEKDRLTIAMPEKLSGSRPQAFEGTGLVVFTFERAVKKAK
jgi:uncharacterized protein (TIGR03067 family)